MRKVKTTALVLGFLVFPVLAGTEFIIERKAEKQRMRELGLQHDTAWSLYQMLKRKAGGGDNPSFDELPDWTGLWSRTRGGLNFDPDQRWPREPGHMPTAKFTPEYHQRLLHTMELRKRNLEYDPLSQCIAPGHPRWLGMPFLREHILRPEQTTFIAEAFNSVRRIYTDGRAHISEEDRFPLHNGDSIGFWDGDKLVIHTNQLMAHIYERSQGEYTEEVETVEIWQRVDDDTILVDAWIYDPPALTEPWYTKQSYTKVTNPNLDLRLSHWACKGTQNNDVIETEDGGSTFRDLTFTTEDDVNGGGSE